VLGRERTTSAACSSSPGLGSRRACFLVRRTHRQHGVMGALIQAAVGVAALAGSPALEAYPVDTAVPGHTRNLFPGTASAFAWHGFQVVARRKPDRPVMRRHLRPA